MLPTLLTLTPALIHFPAIKLPAVKLNVEHERIGLAGAAVTLYAAAALSDLTPAAVESRRAHMLVHEAQSPTALLADCEALSTTVAVARAAAEPELSTIDLLRSDATCFPDDDLAQAMPTTLTVGAAAEPRLPPLLLAYDNSLHAHALPTKAATGATVFALASASSQALSRARRIEPLAVARMSAFGLLLDAPLQHTWHNLLESLMPGTAASVVGGKILIDQLCMAPCQLSMYLAATSILSGGRLSEGMSRIREELFGVFRVHAAFWCAAHAVTFGLMPLEYRMPWCTSCNLVYVTILALLTQHEPQAREPGRAEISVGDRR